MSFFCVYLFWFLCSNRKHTLKTKTKMNIHIKISCVLIKNIINYFLILSFNLIIHKFLNWFFSILFSLSLSLPLNFYFNISIIYKHEDRIIKNVDLIKPETFFSCLRNFWQHLSVMLQVINLKNVPIIRKKFYLQGLFMWTFFIQA
jgi:hypothetical protein